MKMDSSELHKRLDLETRKLEELRKQEEIAYSSFCDARNKRDWQERECSYYFNELLDRARKE